MKWKPVTLALVLKHEAVLICSINVTMPPTFIVVGFNQSQYRLKERADSYELRVQVLSPPQSIVNDIGLIVSAADGSAISKLLLISAWSSFDVMLCTFYNVLLISK